MNNDSFVCDNEGGVVRSDNPFKGICPNDLTNTLLRSEGANDLSDLTTLAKLRQDRLDRYKQQQSFRVSIGKSEWIDYNEFKPEYNLREILNDEVVIEFDTTDKEIVLRAINETGLNLFNAGITFELWHHGGKSPHIHIHDLPIAHLEKDKRALFKTLFIKKYVPPEYHKYADKTLTGIHLVAIEWANHWKGCYGVKKLIAVFNPSLVTKEINPLCVAPDKDLKEYLQQKGIPFHSTSELPLTYYYPKDLESYQKEMAQ